MKQNDSYIIQNGILKKYVGKEKDIVLPPEIKKLSSYSFSNCDAMTSITLSERLTEINAFAFIGCENLREIYIPRNVLKIGKGAFASCTNLQKITVAKDHPVFYVKNECLMEKSSKKLIFGCQNSVIPEETTEIGDYAFAGCKGLWHVEIPQNTVSIGEYAFYRCSGLDKISIPDSVRFIGKSAFERCLRLNQVQLPSKLKTIEESTFALCAKLTSIRIPDGVKKIGDAAFSFCTKLKKVNISESVSEIGYLTFTHCGSLPYLILPERICSIPEIGGSFPIIGPSLCLLLLEKETMLQAVLGYAIAMHKNLATYPEEYHKVYLYYMQNYTEELLDCNEANEEVLSLLQGKSPVAPQEVSDIFFNGNNSDWDDTEQDDFDADEKDRNE